MKLKYYLRGLAVGILLTTIILGIANRDNRPLTEAQIRQRALELGMVEADSARLSSLQSEESRSGPESAGFEDSEESFAEESTTKESSSEESTAEESSSGEGTTEASSVRESGEEESLPDAQPVVLQIKSGASSYTVSRELAALGLVEDAAAFDSFLCDNGYSQTIRVGNYEIMPGTDEEDIAELIAGRNG